MLVLDLISAHWKAIGAVLTGLLIQVVDAQTADWIILTLGSLFVLIKGNNEAAIERVYPNRRRRR